MRTFGPGMNLLNMAKLDVTALTIASIWKFAGCRKTGMISPVWVLGHLKNQENQINLL
jgi:hypothetical protein